MLTPSWEELTYPVRIESFPWDAKRLSGVMWTAWRRGKYLDKIKIFIRKRKTEVDDVFIVTGFAV